MQGKYPIYFSVEEVKILKDMQNQDFFSGSITHVKLGGMQYFQKGKGKSSIGSELWKMTPQQRREQEKRDFDARRGKVDIIVNKERDKWSIRKNTSGTIVICQNDIAVAYPEYARKDAIADACSVYGYPSEISFDSQDSYGIYLNFFFTLPQDKNKKVKDKYQLASCCVFAPKRLRRVKYVCREIGCQREKYKCKSCGWSFSLEFVQRVIDDESYLKSLEVVEEECDKNHIKLPVSKLYVSDKEEEKNEAPSPNTLAAAVFGSQDSSSEKRKRDQKKERKEKEKDSKVFTPPKYEEKQEDVEPGSDS